MTEPELKLQKKIWELTKYEYDQLYGVSTGKSTVSGSFSPHKSAVEIALNSGHIVPQAVLADYPDLQKRN